MISHAERMELARSLSARMVTAYGDDIVLGGVYGSTARNTDTAWSDLELLFVARSGSTVKGQQFLYRSMPVALVVIEQGALEHQFAYPDQGWVYWMCVLSELKILHGDPAQVCTWLQRGQSIPAEKFREAIGTTLSWVVHEPYGRIRSCAERGNTQDVSSAVMEVLSDIRVVLCLLNQRWTTNKFQGFADTFSFAKLPEGYSGLGPALWSARDIDEIVPLAETLVTNFWQLLAREGIQPLRNYQTVDELPSWG